MRITKVVKIIKQGRLRLEVGRNGTHFTTWQIWFDDFGGWSRLRLGYGLSEYYCIYLDASLWICNKRNFVFNHTKLIGSWYTPFTILSRTMIVPRQTSYAAWEKNCFFSVEESSMSRMGTRRKWNRLCHLFLAFKTFINLSSADHEIFLNSEEKNWERIFPLSSSLFSCFSSMFSLRSFAESFSTCLAAYKCSKVASSLRLASINLFDEPARKKWSGKRRERIF